jgi:hypothetical protein
VNKGRKPRGVIEAQGERPDTATISGFVWAPLDYRGPVICLDASIADRDTVTCRQGDCCGSCGRSRNWLKTENPDFVRT